MKKLLIVLLLGIKEFQKPYYQGVAAQLSFYYTLSIVPMLILVTQILGIIFGESITSAIGWIIDRVDNPLMVTILANTDFTTAYASNIFFIIVLVWSASKAQFSMMRISNYTFTDGKRTGEGYLKDRIKAIFVMGFTLATVLFGILALVYGQQIFQLVLEIVGLGEESGKIWLYIRWPIAFTLYFLMLLFNYYILLSEKKPLKDHLPGSIFASIGILLVSYIYSLYVDNMANYDVLYGSLASMAALILWFYFLAWVLFLGIIFNKAWENYRETIRKKRVEKE